MKMKTILMLTLLACAATATTRSHHPAEKQLVTIHVTYQEWNEYRPWLKKKPGTRRLQGIVIPGNRILVPSAHLNDATLIQVEKQDRPPRIPARILHRDPQADLALITVDQKGFFDDLTPVDIAAHAEGDRFFSAKWSNGQLSTASCRWSRVVARDSAIPYFNYPAIYFISDLKSGGWGEPVFSNGQLIGITQYQSDNRIIVIPAEIIQAYLKATGMPVYPGFASLGINWQLNCGHAQADYFGLEGTPRGILIRECIPGGSADGVLKPNDILLELDGHAIDSQGDYLHPQYGRLDFNIIASDGHYVGDIIRANILRDRREITVDIPLKNIPCESMRIPEQRIDEPPPYLFAGGFVFRELDTPYLRAWGNDWSERIPLRLRIYRKMEANNNSPDRQHMIVLADVFPDEYNLGYHDLAQNIVKTVNGRPVNSVADLQEAFQHPDGQFHIIEFVASYNMSTVILDAVEFESATDQIMEKYRIPKRIRLYNRANQTD